ncbi:MAG TPA: hypothetical protein VGQ72_10035 [Pyrinomonadaceae bacterium]|jgi:hypothetical protein|nr:hypothetical protein [Pyrinomonadaceae bacterium]
MSSVSVQAALSVYGKTASNMAGKPVSDLTLEDLFRGIVQGRRENGEFIDRIVCYRSAYNPADIQLAYCRGEQAAVQVFGSEFTKETALIYLDGEILNDRIPDYLRDAFARARESV